MESKDVLDVGVSLYEALSPLSAAASSPAGQSSPPPLRTLDSSADSESYLVFRNEVSLSTAPSEVQVLPEIVATDYFSLDLSADGEETNLDSFTTPARSVAPLPVSEPERSFEGGWFRSNCRFRSPMVQLHKEIIDFCNFLSPTPEEKVSRKAAVDRVSEVIYYIWSNCKVEIFGSFRTGLYLPTSDVDVVILGSDIRTPQLGLHALARALAQRGIAKKMQVIAKARVPIVKFVEKKSGISFDISFDLQNGPMAADFIKDAVSKWPPLRPLCLILKVFLQQRELNEVYTGGIGSYALLTMLIAMLRSVREQHSSPEHNLGVLLVHFFDMYGRKLNTSDVGVSCNGIGTFFSKTSKGFLVKGRPFLIAIEDPQAPENDIGKSSFSYFQVRSAFSMAFSTLTNTKTIMGLGPNRSILGTIIRPDSLLSGRKGGSNGEVTFDNLLPGAGEPLPVDCGGDEQELSCNWQLYDDDEEEPLPRGSIDIIAENGGASSSSGKKRKAYKEKKDVKKKKKFRENGEIEESGQNKRRSGKKQRWRHYRDENRKNGSRVRVSRTS